MESIRFHRGVTLIEMMVVVAIIMILSTIVVIGTSAFQRTMLLATTAYDIGLTMRTAQNFGLGSRQQSNVSGNVGYGVRFTTSPGTSFFMFADSSPVLGTGCHTVGPSKLASAPDRPSGDCVYTTGSDVLAGSPYQLGNGVTIVDLCVYNGSLVTCGKSTLDIVFSRPEGVVYLADQNGYNATYTKASVKIQSPQNTTYFICIGTLSDIKISSTQCVP